MRPVVQDFLFPTICYFGGGAEIAYFGQNSVVYEILKRPATIIRHRSSFSIIEGRHRRTFDKYQLDFDDLFAGEKIVLGEIIENYLNPGTSRIFDEVEDTIKASLNRLDQHLQRDEPTLSDNLANRQKKIIWHIGALRKKFHLAEKNKNRVIDRRIQAMFNSLLPFDHLQERSINYLYYLSIFGENLTDWLYQAVDIEEKQHQIIIF
jgi:uncharacterized protein YllA (UPF0747 family)